MNPLPKCARCGRQITLYGEQVAGDTCVCLSPRQQADMRKADRRVAKSIKSVWDKYEKEWDTRISG